jgi:hypothetical protein
MLAKLVGHYQGQAAHLSCLVFSPAKQDVCLKVGADDGVKVWLNNKLVHSNGATSLRSPPEKIDLTLNKGDNRLLIKAVNRPGAWARIMRPDETSLYGNVRFRAE